MKKVTAIFGIILIIVIVIMSSYYNNQSIQQKLKYEEAIKKIEKLNSELDQKSELIKQLQNINNVENIENPIDMFFVEYTFQMNNNSDMREVAALHRDLWEAEMKHCYSLLLNKAHPQIKDDIMNSKLNYNKFIDDEYLIVGAILASDGFSDESRKDDETVMYGSDSSIFGFEAQAELFKFRTLQLHKYLESIGVNYDYVFNKDELLKNDNYIIIKAK